MAPADEGLHSDDAVRAQVVDGLVVEDELAAIGGAAQIAFQRQPVEHVVVEAGVEHLEAGLAHAFGHVHGDVGLTDGFFGVADSAVEGGHADAGGDAGGLAMERERRLQGGHDSLGHLHPRRRVSTVSDEDGELVASQTGNHVLVAAA